MNLRAKEAAQSTVRGAVDTAQSTVRALNDLVGEATDKIEDALPKRKQKRSKKRRTMGAMVMAAVVAMIAWFAMKRRGMGTNSMSGSMTAQERAGRPDAAFDDRADGFQRQPVGAS